MRIYPENTNQIQRKLSNSIIQKNNPEKYRDLSGMPDAKQQVSKLAMLTIAMSAGDDVCLAPAKDITQEYPRVWISNTQKRRLGRTQASRPACHERGRGHTRTRRTRNTRIAINASGIINMETNKQQQQRQQQRHPTTTNICKKKPHLLQTPPNFSPPTCIIPSILTQPIKFCAINVRANSSPPLSAASIQ